MGRKFKVALALGGGGARGLAHIGVLKVLEADGIAVDVIIGTSIGALVGGAYALKPDAVALEKRVAEVLGPDGAPNTGLKLLARVHREEVDKSAFMHRLLELALKEMFLNLILVRKALLTEKELQDCVTPFLEDVDIAQTRIPFGATAVDLVSGRRVVLKRGPLIRAVMASCAVPGFMPPIEWDEMILVDGGIVESVPAVVACNEGADFIIGVDVGGGLYQPAAIGDGVDTINRAAEIMTFYLSHVGRGLVDVLIEPDVKQNHWTDFSNYRELISRGEAAAASMLPEIRKRLRRRRRRAFLSRPFSWIKPRAEKKVRVDPSDRMQLWPIATPATKDKREPEDRETG